MDWKISFWPRYMLYFIFILLIWFLIVHEGTHAGMCLMIGKSLSLSSVYPHPSISCPVADSDGLLVSHFAYFLYAFGPYLVEGVFLLLMFRRFKPWIYASVIVIICDISVNIGQSLVFPTDFYNLALMDTRWFIVGMVMGAIFMITAVWYLIKSGKEMGERMNSH